MTCLRFSLRPFASEHVNFLGMGPFLYTTRFQRTVETQRGLWPDLTRFQAEHFAAKF